MIHTRSSYSFCSPEKKSQACGGVPRDKMQWLPIQESSLGNFWVYLPKVAGKREQRSVKFQKRTSLAGPWRNAERLVITFVVLKPAAPNSLLLALPTYLHQDPLWREKFKEGEHQLEVSKLRIRVRLVRKEINHVRFEGLPLIYSDWSLKQQCL